MEVLEGAFERMPALRETGIRSIVNGPITYTIDGAPLVGPIPGKRNAYCIIGLRAGLGEGGGHGWLLAQQIVHGEACYDTWCIDPRRFTGHANIELTSLKAIEDYQNEFRFHFHMSIVPQVAHKTTPPTPVLAAEGAEFTVVNGWERIDYIKPAPDFNPTLSFNFDEAFDITAGDVERSGKYGLCEINGFNRFEITDRQLPRPDVLRCRYQARRPHRTRLFVEPPRYGQRRGYSGQLAASTVVPRGSGMAPPPVNTTTWMADPAHRGRRRCPNPVADQRSDHSGAGRPQGARRAFGLRPGRLVERGVPLAVGARMFHRIFARHGIGRQLFGRTGI